MNIRIATFNVENLFSRYAILNLEKKQRENTEINLERLSLTDKMRDGPQLTQLKREPISSIAQQNTAKIINLVDADIICLQEVEGLLTLRDFANKILRPIQKESKSKPYKYFMSIDGNDPRGIDVAIMSRYEIGKIKTHMFEIDKSTKKYLFSRDCLEVEIFIGDVNLHFILNHFKSQISSIGDKNGIKKRTRQANRLSEILLELSSSNNNGNYVVAGDLNAEPEESSLTKLFFPTTGFYNVMEKVNPEDRWTHIEGTKKQQFDYLLISNNLKPKIKKVGIERRGISKSRTIYDGPRLSTVERDGTEASDHCAIYADFQF